MALLEKTMPIQEPSNQKKQSSQDDSKMILSNGIDLIRLDRRLHEPIPSMMEEELNQYRQFLKELDEENVFTEGQEKE